MELDDVGFSIVVTPALYLEAALLTITWKASQTGMLYMVEGGVWWRKHLLFSFFCTYIGRPSRLLWEGNYDLYVPLFGSPGSLFRCHGGRHALACA